MKKEYKTKAKDLILEYAKSHKEQRFSAIDIFEYMNGKGITINITTIYRNLDKMTDSQNLLKYKTAKDERAMYQYIEPDTHCHHHLHMHCKNCGKILHFECTFMEEVRKHCLEHHGFSLECDGSILNGICRECAEKIKEK
ncbi:MAG: transcriptional repressor [Lachnospiraceae bacterium]